jgi:hypothetical protein
MMCKAIETGNVTSRWMPIFVFRDSMTVLSNMV